MPDNSYDSTVIGKPDGFVKLMAFFSTVYICLMTVVFPLFAPTGHREIGRHKWNFYSVTVIVFIVIMVAVGIVHYLHNNLLERKRRARELEEEDTIFREMARRRAAGELNSPSSPHSNTVADADTLELESAAARIAEKYSPDNSSKSREGRAEKSGPKGIVRLWRESPALFFIVAYMIVCFISMLFSYDRNTAIFGFRDWYMGLVAQLSFAMVYILISGNWRFKKPILLVAISGSLAVYILGVLNRFGIDPLGFYQDRTRKQIFDYLSTIGQTSHYSSYICLFIPLAVVGFCFGKKAISRVFCAVVMAVGFMTTVTQNSDSAYFALTAYMLVLMFIAFSERWIFSRFVEVLIICVASFKAMGFALMAYTGSPIELDAISLFLSEGNVTWFVLGGLIIVRLILAIAVRKTPKGAPFRAKPLRWVVLALFVIGIVGGITYIVMNTQGLLSPELSSANNYLLFNDGWGNHRGIEWRAAVGSYIQEPLFRKVIGAGPDCFAHMVYKYYPAELNRELDGLVLQNCHNEWLNCLINTGVLGVVAYLGIFVTLFISCMKGGRKVYWLYGVAMSIAAYVAHNTFCYQSVTCTPLIFLLMGMAGAVLRQIETGKSFLKRSENAS